MLAVSLTLSWNICENRSPLPHKAPSRPADVVHGGAAALDHVCSAAPPPSPPSSSAGVVSPGPDGLMFKTMVVKFFMDAASPALRNVFFLSDVAQQTRLPLQDLFMVNTAAFRPFSGQIVAMTLQIWRV